MLNVIVINQKPSLADENNYNYHLYIIQITEKEEKLVYFNPITTAAARLELLYSNTMAKTLFYMAMLVYCKNPGMMSCSANTCN